jgi:hypothetical protein
MKTYKPQPARAKMDCKLFIIYMANSIHSSIIIHLLNRPCTEGMDITRDGASIAVIAADAVRVYNVNDDSLRFTIVSCCSEVVVSLLHIYL